MLANLITAVCANSHALGSDQREPPKDTAARSASTILPVTSMPLAQLVASTSTTKNHLLRTFRQIHPHTTLFVLYDPDSSITAERLEAARSRHVHAEDLFVAMPELSIYMEKHSPLERWYGMRGFVEPLGNNQYLFWNKLLIRKPVAIYCAMRRALEQRAPASSATQHVLWADTDVEFVAPLDDAYFAFVSSFDVAYVPIVGPKGAQNFAKHSELAWWLDSGIMHFAANRRGSSFVEAAIELYEGGLLRLADYCGCPIWNVKEVKNGYCRVDRCPKEMGKMVFSNDVFAWATAGHLALRRKPSEPPWLCCLDSTVRQAWFAFHTTTLRPNATASTSPWSLSRYATHHTVKDGTLTARIFSYLGDKQAQRTGRNATKEPGFTFRSDDPQLSTTSFKNSSFWHGVAWNDQTRGIPLQPRIARCGCQTTHNATPREGHVWPDRIQKKSTG